VSLRWIADRIGKRESDVPAIPPPRPETWLDPAEAELMPPRSVWVGPDDSISHYYRWVWEYLAYLTLSAELQRHEAVLEIGCGHGRTARGLLSYMRSPGEYVGIDVHRTRIDDATRRITAKYPNFGFIWADVRTDVDNPAGLDAANYVFPLEDARFDVAYGASLFTHLLPDEARNYFKEVGRVLKPDGRCLFSFFLLDYYRGPGTTISSIYEFDSPLPGHDGVAIRDPAAPHAIVGYRMSIVDALARAAGLEIVKVFPGLWSENSGFAVNKQDLVLFRRLP
jgi:SAM-dependent methyltransferase